MEQLHRIPEQNLAAQFFGAVGAQEIMKIQRERRITQSLRARSIAGRQRVVAPTGIEGDLMEKQVQLRTPVPLTGTTIGGSALSPSPCCRAVRSRCD